MPAAPRPRRRADDCPAPSNYRRAAVVPSHRHQRPAGGWPGGSGRSGGDPVDGGLELDLPAFCLRAAGDLADSAQVHGVVAVESKDSVRHVAGHQFPQLPHVADRPLAAGPDGGVVPVRLEQLDLSRVDGHPPVIDLMDEKAVDRGRMGFHSLFISRRKAGRKRPARVGNRPFPPQTAVLHHERPFSAMNGRFASPAAVRHHRRRSGRRTAGLERYGSVEDTGGTWGCWRLAWIIHEYRREWLTASQQVVCE